MKGKTLCIVIALMVLSVSAIIGAERLITYGGFSSTLNGVPVDVTLARVGSVYIEPMRADDLLINWEDHVGKFVRFRGTVRSIGVSESEQAELSVGDFTVYPLDAPYLPEVQPGHEYEFTGFFVADNVLELGGIVAPGFLGVYAFKIRHLGEAD